MSMNRVLLHGRLMKEPEFGKTEYGSYARISVVCPDTYVNKRTGERGAAFVDCIAFRHVADFISRWFHKGSYICIEGHLQNNNYTDRNGIKRYQLEVLCDTVSFGGDREAKDNPDRYDNQTSNYTPTNKPTQKEPEYKDPVDTIDSILSGEDDFDEVLSDGELPF